MRIKININFIVNYFEESEIDPSGKKVCTEIGPILLKIATNMKSEGKLDL